MSKEHCVTFPRGYLPMDCPTCGRLRLLYGLNADGGVVYVECERCGANSDDETLFSPRQQPVDAAAEAVESLVDHHLKDRRPE